MIIATFLALLAATLGFGAWLATRWARAGYGIDTVVAKHRRDVDVNDAAEMAETACDWSGELS